MRRLVAGVAYTERTQGCTLSHPIFEGVQAG
jgi:hypothetical protein